MTAPYVDGWTDYGGSLWRIKRALHAPRTQNQGKFFIFITTNSYD